MVSSNASSVADYLASLPPDRRAAISAVRDVVLENLPEGFEEGMQYGMIGWYIPLSRYPVTYNGQPLGVAALASQKDKMSLYLMSVYGDPKLERDFLEAYRKSGKKLDMGKSCVRFKRLEDLPLDAVANVIESVSVVQFIERYEAARANTAGGKKAAASAKGAKSASTSGKAGSSAKERVTATKKRAATSVKKGSAKVKKGSAKVEKR